MSSSNHPENNDKDNNSSNFVSNKNKKRRHPDSIAVKQKTSLELLQLIENPNFEELARQRPEFRQAWEVVKQQQKKQPGKPFSAYVTQDFTIALTRAILQTHFRLKLPYLEQNHLCPPVPNRFYYVHWIHTHLLSSSKKNEFYNDNYHHQVEAQSTQSTYTTPFGVDIGSGSTAIYPLLAAKYFSYHMCATEIDEESVEMATNNVIANQLESKIMICHVPPTQSQDPTQSLLPPGGPLEGALTAVATRMHGAPHFLDFVMTNPPFYDSSQPMEQQQQQQQQPSILQNPRIGDGRARTAMTVSEGLYPGGEVGFVLEMIADSLKRHRQKHAFPTTTTTTTTTARWYSSMLGKKSSLVHLQKVLIHLLGPAHVEVTEYGPGQYTRWFLAWTLERPRAFAPNARVSNNNNNNNNNNTSFYVTPQETNTTNRTYNMQPPEAVSEVISRIVAFCNSSPGGWNLATSIHYPNVGGLLLAEIQIQEKIPLAVTYFVDESESKITIPNILLQALGVNNNNQNSSNNTHNASWMLPPEGHFIIKATIQSISSAVGTVQVQLDSYQHSSRGMVAIQKLTSTLQGEICRTNRKWRRILQRRHEESHAMEM